jgi:hypothetical protein
MIVFFNELGVRAFDLTHGRLLSWEVIVAGRRRVLAGRSGVLASPLLRTLFDDQILTHGQSASPHLIPNRSLDRHPCCSVTPWPSSWLNATCLVSLRTFLVSIIPVDLREQNLLRTRLYRRETRTKYYLSQLLFGFDTLRESPITLF